MAFYGPDGIGGIPFHGSTVSHRVAPGHEEFSPRPWLAPPRAGAGNLGPQDAGLVVGGPLQGLGV